MSDEAVGGCDDLNSFIEDCNAFVKEKRMECEEMICLLTQHPESPEPAGDACSVLSTEDLCQTLNRLSILIDEVSEDVSLLPKESPEKKSSHHLRPLGEKSRKSSPSPTRPKIRNFLSNEYENLCKQIGTKWRRTWKSASPPKKDSASASSANLQSRTNNNKAITDILVEIEKIQLNLAILDGTVKSFEDKLKKHKSSSKLKKRMKAIEALKNTIIIDYRDHVDNKIKENKEVRDYINENSGKTREERLIPSKPAAEHQQEQPHAQVPSTSPKASSKYSCVAGPSTASPGAEASSGTPKRTRTKSVSREGKKKKGWFKSKNTSKSQHKRGLKIDCRTESEKVSCFSSPESSDVESRDTDSTKFDGSVQDYDLSETENSKDKMEES